MEMNAVLKYQAEVTRAEFEAVNGLLVPSAHPPLPHHIAHSNRKEDNISFPISYSVIPVAKHSLPQVPAKAQNALSASHCAVCSLAHNTSEGQFPFSPLPVTNETGYEERKIKKHCVQTPTSTIRINYPKLHNSPLHTLHTLPTPLTSHPVANSTNSAKYRARLSTLLYHGFNTQFGPPRPRGMYSALSYLTLPSYLSPSPALSPPPLLPNLPTSSIHPSIPQPPPPPPPTNKTKPKNLTLPTKQIFFSILVLGLSGHLVASQVYGGAPSSTNYNVFLGIWLLVVAFVGLAASFVSVLGGVVMAGLDALSVLFAFAGGVVSAFDFVCVFN